MKKKKIFRYIVLPLVLILALAAIYIYKEYYRTHTDTAKLKPDYSLSATELLKEFETSEQSSNKKYWDKVVRVEGMVKDIEQDEKGFYSVVLGDTSSLSSVRCSIDSLHNGEATRLEPGINIAVKGICSGYNADELLGSDVVLVRAVVEIKN